MAAVVTDRALLRAALGALLRDAGVGLQTNGWTVADLATSRRKRPDVFVVLTAAATVGADAAALRDVFERDPASPVVVVILDDVVVCGPPLIAAGGTVVVPADVPVATLTAAVDAAVAGERLVHPDVLAAALGGLRSEAARSTRDLTPRELDVLRHVAAGRTNAAIGAELGVAASTVKTHVASLLDKLGARDRAHAVAIGFRSGLIR